MASSAYLTFRPRRVAASLVIGAVVVVAVALLAKVVVEGLFGVPYEIHWTETVPFLVVGAAFVTNAWLNERAESPGSES